MNECKVIAITNQKGGVGKTTTTIKEAMEKLWRSRVAVFGIGGVGGYTVEALVRSGIGAVDLIDDDRICLLRFVRQICHFYLFCNIFSRTPRVQEIAHMTDKQMIQFWNAFALSYNGPDNLDAFQHECRRFAALDIIMLGMVQKLTFSERFFLGTLAKKMLK